MIPLEQCRSRFIYRIKSRNLIVGVFDGEDGFIGIREKGNVEYLFTEYHYDTGAPFGTVTPVKELRELPSWIKLSESLGDICSTCGRMIHKIPDANSPTKQIWEHIPFKVFDPREEEVVNFNHDGHTVRASMLRNIYLFNHLKEVEENL